MIVIVLLPMQYSILIFKFLLSFFPLPGTHLLFINMYNYISAIISSKEPFTAAGLGASSLKLYRELYNIPLLDLIDIMCSDIKHSYMRD